MKAAGSLRILAVLACAAGTPLLAAPAAASLQGGRAALDANDYAAALRQFTDAAQAGNADAQYEVGLLYLLGRGGIATDYRQAAGWFSRAAEQGHAKAQVRLGDMLAQGLGVPQDYDRARQLLRAAVPRLQEAEKRYANDYAERIEAYLQARATQPAAAPAQPAGQQRPQRQR